MSTLSKKIQNKIEQVKKIISEKVNNKIVAEHSVFGHFYRFTSDNSIIASVTTRNILEKKHLPIWAVKLAIEFLEEGDRWKRLKGSERNELIKAAQFIHTDVRDTAGTIGSRVHKILEDFETEWITTGLKPKDIRKFILPEDDPRVYGGARSGEAAFEKYKVIPIAIELLVGIPGIGAGTLDLIVINEKGELELFDHKTSNFVKGNDFYACQVATYKFFFEKMTGLKIKRSRIIHLDKWSNKFHVYNVPNEKQAYDIFKHLSKVYDWLNNGEEKLKEDKIIVKI